MQKDKFEKGGAGLNVANNSANSRSDKLLLMGRRLVSNKNEIWGQPLSNLNREDQEWLKLTHIALSMYEKGMNDLYKHIISIRDEIAELTDEQKENLGGRYLPRKLREKK